MTFSTARRGAGVLAEPPGLTVPVRGLRGLHGPPPPHRHPVIAGAASLGIRESIDHRRRPARVIAAFPSAVYLEVETSVEPRVVAVVASDAVRLPSAVVIAATTRQLPFETVREGDTAMVGDGAIDITRRFQVRVRRWWDPTPVLGPISPARLAHGIAILESAMAGTRWGLAGHRDPHVLAECCASGDLASAVDAAERIVGLGPGLTPSGDDALCGLLLALRLLGGAVPQCASPVPGPGAGATPQADSAGATPHAASERTTGTTPQAGDTARTDTTPRAGRASQADHARRASGTPQAVSASAAPQAVSAGGTPQPGGAGTTSGTPQVSGAGATPQAGGARTTGGTSQAGNTTRASTTSQADRASQADHAGTAGATHHADSASDTPHADSTSDTPHADSANATPHADSANATPHADSANATPHADSASDTPEASGADTTPQAGDAAAMPQSCRARTTGAMPREGNAAHAGAKPEASGTAQVDVRRGGTSVWLADWLGAAVTAHADDRTTALAATLLHCAARGQASVEVAGVLRGIAGQEPVLPAVRRLLSTGHTSGADLAWGLLAGCRAALSLSTRQDPS